MNLWRLKHIPTGLYFKPSKHRSKCNLSKKGKVYTRKPTCKWMGGLFHHPDDVPKDKNGVERKWWHDWSNREVVDSEWVAEKIETKDEK